LLGPGGSFLAMKGQRPEAEIAALPAGFAASAIHSLTVPYLNEERHLVQVVRA
jgi:16S rRNA (guanine527-N7)-methyltransferase